jgi:sigma-B regulation protein RsbU (phosphoserine phosphatase)
MSILVVDDNEDVRQHFEAALESGGHRGVIAVESAAAAFTFLKLDAPLTAGAPPVDLVLLDIVMPDIDGIQACLRIRLDPRYADVPIVMTTSLNDMESVDNAFQSGATAYLTKPLKAVDLLACVRSNLNLRTALAHRSARERELMQHAPFQF